METPKFLKLEQSRDIIQSPLREIENRDLLFISYSEDIPMHRPGLYFSISIDNDGNISHDSSYDQVGDPSTIYVHLPISEDAWVSPLPYWPHYTSMSSGQRFTYLNWLRDVDQPIEIGYVFLYYYGLERHMLIGDFEKAFNQIIRLRNIHKQKSFLSYSEKALIHACILQNRMDLLADLHEKTEISGFSNSQMLLAYNLGLDLSADNLVNVMNSAFPLARKAIKENRPLMHRFVSEALTEKYGVDSFAIKGYDLSKTRTTSEIRFANYTFPEKFRKVEITDFYQCKALMTDVQEVFFLAYDKLKRKKADDRRVKAGKSPEDIADSNRKKALSRYVKLLKDKRITQSEYDLLTSNLA